MTLHRVVEEGTHTYIIMDFAPDGDLFSQILYGCRYLGNTRLIKHIFNQLLDAVDALARREDAGLRRRLYPNLNA